MHRRARTCQRRSLVFLLILFCSFLPGATSLADENETLTRQLTLKSGGRLTLENTRGDIHITTWKGDRVEIKVQKTGLSSEEMELVPVAIEAREDEIHITSVFPVYAPELKVRVDYRLRVPEVIDLKRIRCRSGEVEISDIRGTADIRVEKGDITVKDFTGILEVTTLVGSIKADVQRVSPGDFIKLKTFSGDISLRVPKRTKAHWVVRTLNGTIESKIPFEVHGDFGPQVVHDTIENGSVDAEIDEPIIRAYSVMGNIRVTEK